MAAEPEERVVTAAGDLAGGHDGDAGQRLAVEQQQAVGGTIRRVERGVVQQPGGQCPPLVLADGRADGAGRSGDFHSPAVAAYGAQDRKSLARTADGPACSHWSMSAWPASASVVPRPRSQARRLMAARMLLRACAVGLSGRVPAAEPALSAESRGGRIHATTRRIAPRRNQSHNHTNRS